MAPPLWKRALKRTRKFLRRKLKRCRKAGAELIQIDEPAILQTPDDWRVFEQALDLLLEARDRGRKAGRNLELALYTYFHDCTPLYEKLLELPVDIVGIDFTCGGALIEKVASSGVAEDRLLWAWSMAASNAWKILATWRGK